MGISRHNRNSPATEAQLTAAAREGDCAAFEALYRLHHRGLWSHCYRMLGDGHLAEDVVQETFLRAWRSMASFDPARPLWPWILTIAQRLCTDIGRKRSEPPVAGNGDLSDDHPHVVSLDADGHDDGHDLAVAFAELPDRYRRLLFLRAVEGWSYGQLAEVDGSTVSSVAKVLSRAKERVRVCLTGHGHEMRILILPALLVAVRDMHARFKARVRDAASQFQMMADRVPLFERAGTSILGVALFSTAVLGASFSQAGSDPGTHARIQADARQLADVPQDNLTSSPDRTAIDETDRLLEERVEVTDDVGTRAHSDTPKQGRVAPTYTSVRVDAHTPVGWDVWHEERVNCNGSGSSILPKDGQLSGLC